VIRKTEMHLKHKIRSDDGRLREKLAEFYVVLFLLCVWTTVVNEGLLVYTFVLDLFILQLKCLNVRRFPPPSSHNNKPR